MRVSLDYDRTYTADPALWDRFVSDATAAGHEVVCVTMRYPSEPITMPCPIIYTGRRAKRPFLDERGVSIDVWIDDSPGWIFSDSA